MKRSTFLVAAAAAVALGMASSWAFGRVVKAKLPQHSRLGALAVWIFKTDDLGEMARYADAVIVGRHAARYPGRTAYSSTGEDALEFELNDFVLTEQPLKGNIIGDTVTVERTSGPGPDGPVFHVGEGHLLFLKKQPGSNFYLVINDEARFLVEPIGRLTSGAPGKVTASLRGRHLEDARALVRTSLQTK